MSWPFEPLKMFGYDVLVVDPPWDFENYSAKGTGKGADPHYGVLPLDAIKAFRIGELARRDCLLLLWATESMRPQAHEVMAAWGFTYKTALVWRKTTRNGKVRMGTGYRARSCHEPVLVGTLGNPQHKPFPSLFDGVARQHSRKPDEFYHLVDRCCPKAFRADVFARQARAGWDVFGDQADKFDAAAA